MSRPKPTARPASAGLIDVRVIPRAGRSGVAGLRDGALLVRLAAAPVDGAANAELIAVLAAALDLPKRNIEIVSGDRSRAKRVRVTGIAPDAVLARLGLSRATDLSAEARSAKVDGTDDADGTKRPAAKPLTKRREPSSE